MQHQINGANKLRRTSRSQLPLIAICALVTTAAIVSAGCDPDDYNLGQDSSSRPAGATTSTGPNYYSNRLGHVTRSNSPEFLVPTDSSFDKVPPLADPDAFASKNDPLVQKMPDAGIALDKEDHVAGNFKYYKEGYREPLLPIAVSDKGAKPIGSDDLSMNEHSATALKPGASDIAGPAGTLGELQSQHNWRAKYAKKLDPHGSYDYSSGVGGEDDNMSESIIRSGDPTSAPPTPQAPQQP